MTLKCFDDKMISFTLINEFMSYQLYILLLRTHNVLLLGFIKYEQSAFLEHFIRLFCQITDYLAPFLQCIWAYWYFKEKIATGKEFCLVNSS